MPPRLELDDRTRVLVLTGAGISAESGLATFRGAGGLWSGHRVEEVATPEAFERDPELVWRFYSERRAAAAAAEPNDGHRALARLEARLGDRFLLATQNVDGLHARAGSRRIVELHGSLWARRCSRCDRPATEDGAWPVVPPLPTCDLCGTEPPAFMRPAIVWFGEQLDVDDERRVKRFVKDAEWAGERLVFLAVGTSATVWPAAGYARYARDFGAETWLVNLEAAENVEAFDRVVLGPAGAVLPALLGV